MVEFNQKDAKIKTLNKIEINGLEYKCNYNGMVNKDNKPHGFGRAIDIDNNHIIDGQFKNGVLHGYHRIID